MFQVSIHFNLRHPRPKMTNTSFFVVVRLLLTRLNHYFNDSVDANVFFSLFKVTSQWVTLPLFVCVLKCHVNRKACNLPSTVEPRFNEPLLNEVLDITNDILCPGQSYSKMYGIEPRYNEPRYNEFFDITNIIRKPKSKIYLDITNYNVNTRQKINADQINTLKVWFFFVNKNCASAQK